MHAIITAALPWIQAAALVAAPTIMAWFAFWFRAWLIKRHYRTDVFDALTRAVATGYAAVRGQGLQLSTRQGMTVGVEAALGYWLATVSDKLALIGMSPEKAAIILEAGLKDYANTKVVPPAVVSATTATVVAEVAPNKESTPP